MKKGFTLIELLAVIIILAIVALIATPIVLDVVNDAKDSAAKSEASMIVSGVNNYCAAADMKEQLTGETNICEDGVEPEEVKKMVDLGNAKVNSITFDGKVTSLEVESNDRTVNYNGNEYSIDGETVDIPEEPSEPSEPSEPQVTAYYAFGAGNCTLGASRIDCPVVDFNCAADSDGNLGCYDGTSAHRCDIMTAGTVSCE